MYRPQFVYLPSPANSYDGRVAYSFDQSNTAAFQANVPVANAFSTPISLPLDSDADFLLRGIQISATVLQVGLLDPFGNPLVVNQSNGAPGVVLPALWMAAYGAGIVPLECDNWGVFCPAGSSLSCFLYNPGNTPVAAPVITLHGIKRYCGQRCGR